MRKFVLLVLDYLAGLFLFTIFAISLYSIVQNIHNPISIITLRLWGNHALILFMLSAIGVSNSLFLLLFNKKYAYLKSALIVLALTYLHEFLWFFYTSPLFIYSTNIILAIEWWLYGVLFNAVALLVLTFFVKIRISVVSILLYTALWIVLYAMSYNMYDALLLLSSNGYTQSNALYNDLSANAIEIAEWLVFLTIFSTEIDTKKWFREKLNNI